MKQEVLLESRREGLEAEEFRVGQAEKVEAESRREVQEEGQGAWVAEAVGGERGVEEKVVVAERDTE